jgi:hypothetical protein
MSNVRDWEDAAPGRKRCLELAGMSLILALALSPAGCGDAGSQSASNAAAVAAFKNQVVTGKVTLANGKPLTKGRVVLFPLQDPRMPLNGDIKPDGTFTLTAFGFGTGVTYGEFKVSVEPPGYLPGGKPRKLAFPAKYLDSATSDLTVTINSETKQLPTIVLK